MGVPIRQQVMESTESYWAVIGCYVISLGVLYTLSLYRARLLWQACQERYEQLCRQRDLEVLQGSQPIHPDQRVEQWLAAQQAQQAQDLEQRRQQQAAYPWVLVRRSPTGSRTVARFLGKEEAIARAFELSELLPADTISVEHDPLGRWRRPRRNTHPSQPHSKRKRYVRN